MHKSNNCAQVLNYPIPPFRNILISGLRKNNLPLLWLKRRLTSQRSSNKGGRRPSVDDAPREETADSALGMESQSAADHSQRHFSTRTRENRNWMEAKMETAGSRAKRRPSHPRSHSLSLALCRSRPKGRTTNSTRTLGGFSLAGSLDAVAQRARLHHPNCACPAPPPVRRPSRIHAGCIEFIPGCRQPRGARSFFPSNAPALAHSRGFPNRDCSGRRCMGLGLATLAQKHGGAEPNELARPLR